MFKFLLRALFAAPKSASKQRIETRVTARKQPSSKERDVKQKAVVNAPKSRRPTAVPFDATTRHHAPKKKFVEGAAYVIDGDTIVIKKTQIRIFGVDAPELNHPFGQKAKWAMVRLCKGQTVRAEIIEEDAHGRTVAKCHLADGRDLSAEMVKQGLAIDWPKFSGGIYSSLETSDARKKLWLADARQKGRMHVWEKFEAKKS